MTYAPYQPPMAPPVRVGLAITALVIGIVAFLSGWVPIFGIVIGLTAIVFGVVALTQGQSKPMSIIGLSLGAVATLCSLLITIGLFNIGNVETQAADPKSSEGAQPSEERDTPEVSPEEPTEEPASEPTNDGSSRDAPLPLGSSATSGDWTVTVNSVNLDATQAVTDANMFNSPPSEGNVYILVNATATYAGTDPQGESPMTTISYVSPDGQTFDGLTDMAVAPEAFDLMSPLYEGASTTGNFVLSVPAASITDGRLAVRPGVFSDKVFFSMQ